MRKNLHQAQNVDALKDLLSAPLGGTPALVESFGESVKPIQMDEEFLAVACNHDGRHATYQLDRTGWPVKSACNGTEETQRVVRDGMGLQVARDGIGHGAFAASACGVLRLQARVEVGRDEALSKGSIPDGGDESEARGCVHW
jgi:hypothetical protein